MWVAKRPSLRLAFEEYLEALRKRLDREGRSATSREMDKLRCLWDTWDRNYQARSSIRTDLFHVPARPPSWGPLEGELAPTPDEPPGKPRHRPPNPLPVETIRLLEKQLARRRAGGNPLEGSWTQAAIAERLKLSRRRVRQAEGLLRVGWGLLRSHPEFWAASVDDGFVRWPSVNEARQILASERPGSPRN